MQGGDTLHCDYFVSIPHSCFDTEKNVIKFILHDICTVALAQQLSSTNSSRAAIKSSANKICIDDMFTSRRQKCTQPLGSNLSRRADIHSHWRGCLKAPFWLKLG